MRETATIVANRNHKNYAPQEGEIEAFVAKVGERVRALRIYRNISRRILSERSGVSQRYLAQLERGEGNISIALLFKVATALDEKIEWFVRDEAINYQETQRLLTLYGEAPAHRRHEVLQILDPQLNQRNQAQRVAFIGLRGAGKSTLGPLAAREFGIPFIELNDAIERSNGMSVNETIALYGQEGYRLLERQAIERIANNENKIVLAVAGGIVSEPETYAYLLNNYHTVWLKAAPEEHMERVRAQGDERPMAGNPAALDELRKILTSRESQYAKADVCVNTSQRSLRESLTDVVAAIQEQGFLVETA